jgi:hypothetical protein
MIQPQNNTTHTTPRVDSKNNYTFYYQHDTIPNITNQLKHN